MVVPKANRTARALLILAPLGVVLAGWFAFALFMGGTSADRAMFDVMIFALAVGSATLWLLAHHLALGAWHKSLLGAMGVGLGVTLVAGLSLGFGSNETLVGTAVVGVMMIVMVLGYALAARGYRSRRAWRFLVYLAVGGAAGSLVSTLLVISVFSLILGNGPGSVRMFLTAVIWGGFMVAGMVFLTSLPFAILGLCSRFFRQRLILCSPPQPASSCDNCDASAPAVT
ncbi:MAG: hypothetical protein ABFE13_19210 [Phycisphaerales bacterium]